MTQRQGTYRPTVKEAEQRFYRRLLGFVIMMAILAGLYLLWPRSANTAAEAGRGDEMILNVVPLEAGPVTIRSKYIGYVTPIKSVEVQPKINGYLDEIWVEGGQEVKAGDNLVLIRQNEYKAQLDAAAAQVTQAQADFNNARVYFQRIQKAGAKAISMTEIDNAKARYLAAQGALAQAKANRDLAQVNYDYTVLQAPISGTVGNVDLTKGNYVSPASPPLFRIIQFDPIRVVFSITDKDYLDEISRHPDDLFSGEKILLRLSDGKIYPQPGKFQFTANEIDRSTNSIAVYADFANPAKTLVANAYVDVILERTLPKAYRIRQNYVRLTPGENYVYTVKGRELYKTPVEIITTQGDHYVVADTFGADEYLVTDQVGEVNKNTKIKIKINRPQSASAAGGKTSGEKA